MSEIIDVHEAMAALDKLSKLCHNTAAEKGWWDRDVNALEKHMLMVSEIAEATEAARAGYPHYFEKEGKPEGEAVELADCVIRILDYFGYRKWSLSEILAAKFEYNQNRSYRHGNKKY